MENPSVRMVTEFLWDSAPLAQIHDDGCGVLLDHRSSSHWHSVFNLQTMIIINRWYPAALNLHNATMAKTMAQSSS